MRCRGLCMTQLTCKVCAVRVGERVPTSFSILASCASNARRCAVISCCNAVTSASYRTDAEAFATRVACCAACCAVSCHARQHAGQTVLTQHRRRHRLGANDNQLLERLHARLKHANIRRYRVGVGGIHTAVVIRHTNFNPRHETPTGTRLHDQAAALPSLAPIDTLV